MSNVNEKDRLKNLVYQELKERLSAIKAGTDPICCDPTETNTDVYIAELVEVGRLQSDADILHLYREIMDIMECDYDTAILIQALTNIKIYLHHLKNKQK